MSACPCSLVATGERLLGKLSDDDRKMLEELDQADANAPLFDAHMAFEEEVIGPHMTRADFYRMRAGHAFIRSCRRRNLIVSPAFVAAHAEWERKIFPTIGAASSAVARNGHDHDL